MAEQTADYYGELWSALVTDVEAVVSDELARAWAGQGDTQSCRAEWRQAIEEWTSIAAELLSRWMMKRRAGEEALEMLRALPTFVNSAPLPDLFRLLASYSFFRLQPYLRTLVWDQHRNKVIPEQFIRKVVTTQPPSDLSAGETAFAAFASDDDSCADGMVVADGFSNLRGTFSLIDRILGLRSNAFVPIRVRQDHNDRGELLGMLVVSLPLPEMFRADITKRLSRTAQKYSELLHLLLRMEEGQERAEVGRRLLTTKSLSIEDFCLELVGRADERPSRPPEKGGPRLPACMVVRCVTPTEKPTEVQLRSAEAFLERGSENKHIEIESELACYGIGAAEREPLGISQEPNPGRLYVIVDGKVVEALPDEGVSVLNHVSNAVNAGREFLRMRGLSEAVESHVCLELFKEAGRHLMDFVSSKQVSSAARDGLLLLLRLLGHNESELEEVHAHLNRFRKWINSTFKSSGTVTLAIGRSCPVTALPAGQSYLSTFQVDDGGGSRRQSLPARVALELGRTHGFLSWIRAMAHLMGALPEGAESSLKMRAGFKLSSADGTASVLTSFVVSEGNTLLVRRAGDGTNFSFGDKCLAASWQWRACFFPLAVRPIRQRTYRVDLSATVTGALPDVNQLFSRLYRVDAGMPDYMLPSRPNRDTPRESRAMGALGFAIERLPWFKSTINAVALIPLSPSREEQVLSLDRWAERPGAKRLLIVGCLERPRAAVALARPSAMIDVNGQFVICGFDGRRDGDPLVRRFCALCAVLHNLADQRALRLSDMYQRKQLGRLAHDLRSDLRALETGLDSNAAPTVLHSAATAVVETFQRLRDYSTISSVGGVTFEELVAHLRRGADMGVARVVRKIRDVPRERLMELLPKLDGLSVPIQSRPELEELLGNLLGNALYAALPYEGRVAIKITKPWIIITNPCDAETWVENCAVLNGLRAPVPFRGLDEIRTLVTLLDLNLKARQMKLPSSNRVFARVSVGTKEMP